MFLVNIFVAPLTTWHSSPSRDHQAQATSNLTAVTLRMSVMKVRNRLVGSVTARTAVSLANFDGMERVTCDGFADNAITSG
jgi:hypothetical protein